LISLNKNRFAINCFTSFRLLVGCTMYGS